MSSAETTILGLLLKAPEPYTLEEVEALTGLPVEQCSAALNSLLDKGLVFVDLILDEEFYIAAETL